MVNIILLTTIPSSSPPHPSTAPTTFHDLVTSYSLNPTAARKNYADNRHAQRTYFDDSIDQINHARFVSKIAYQEAQAVAFCESRLVEQFPLREQTEEDRDVQVGDAGIDLDDLGVRDKILALKEEFLAKGTDLEWDNQVFARSVVKWQSEGSTTSDSSLLDALPWSGRQIWPSLLILYRRICNLLGTDLRKVFVSSIRAVVTGGIRNFGLYFWTLIWNLSWIRLFNSRKPDNSSTIAPAGLKILNATIDATDRLMHLSVDMMPVSTMLRHTLQSLTRVSNILRSSSVISLREEFAEALLALITSASKLQTTIDKYDQDVSTMISKLTSRLKHSLQELERYALNAPPPQSIASLFNPLVMIALLAFLIIFLIGRRDLRRDAREKYVIGTVFIFTAIVWLASSRCDLLPPIPKSADYAFDGRNDGEILWCPPLRAVFTPMLEGVQQKARKGESNQLLRKIKHLLEGLEHDLGKLQNVAGVGFENSEQVKIQFSTFGTIQQSNEVLVHKEIMHLNDCINDPLPRAGFFARLSGKAERERHQLVTRLRYNLTEFEVERGTLRAIDHAHQDATLVFLTAIAVLEEMKSTQEGIQGKIDEYETQTSMAEGREIDWNTMLLALGEIRSWVRKLEEQGAYQHGERQRWLKKYGDKQIECTNLLKQRKGDLSWDRKAWDDCVLGA